MKKLILIPLLILIFFAGCKEEIGENNNFTLKIQFAQSVNDTVRISYRDVEGAESTAEVVITNGEGSLNDSTCHPFWARFNSRSFRNNGGFLLSAGEVTLKLDTSNYGKSVTGSPANTEIEQQFKNFSTELKDSASHYLALRSKLRKEVGGDVYGPMEDSLNFLYEKMVHFNNLREIEYISTYPKSYVSLAKARGMYKSAVSYDKVKSLYELLDVDRQNDIVGRELFEKVKIAEKTGLGQPAPLFALPDSTGKEFSLADFKGKYVLVDFWYSGCAPCRKQFPRLRDIYADFKPKGFEIVGVSHDMLKHKQNWLLALRKDRPTWLNLLDEENHTCEAYGIESFPSNFMVGPDGETLAANLEPAELERWLMKRLK